MYEDFKRNKKIIESTYGSIENYTKMQSNIASMTQHIMPLHSTDELFNIGRLMSERLSGLLAIIDDSLPNRLKEIQRILGPFSQLDQNIINDSAHNLSKILGNYVLLDFTDDEFDENTDNELNAKIVEEIFEPDQEKHSNKEESVIITLSPVNDRVLKYLSENPQAFYQLTGTEFEIVMAEIYHKLGYKVERTQSTRDGGKDIIIRKPEILGDFIYYVECKRYAAKNHIGVGIIKNLIGTINTDRVNGGVLATTSYFSRDSKKFISENNYSCQIQMHDYDYIRGLLDKVV
jgi:restriction endonuclease Mrr